LIVDEYQTVSTSPLNFYSREKVTRRQLLNQSLSQRRQEMEARIYFNKQAVLRRLEKAGVLKKEEGKKESGYNYTNLGNTTVIREDKEPDLAYVKANDVIDLEIHRIFKGLKIVNVTIFDTLLKEENQHIKQGTDSMGRATYSVTYTDEKFDIPTASQYGCAYAFRSLIKVRVRSTNLQSAVDCYKSIREGKSSENWKGSNGIPSHCGLSPALKSEEMY